MDKRTYQPELQPAVSTTLSPACAVVPTFAPDWRQQLPTLVGLRLTLRELTLADAPALFAALNTDDVERFITTPPTSVEGYERFIRWVQRERAAGRHVSFAVVPHGMTKPIGMFQLRQLDTTFSTGEWGFALGTAYWGAGYFTDAARLVLEFAFDTVGVRRLEARSAVANGRGNGALRKMGAVHEGVLRRAFRKGNRLMDQSLWSILADEWRHARALWAPAIVH